MKETLSLRTHNARAIRQMRSALNRWATGERLHRSPQVTRPEDRNELGFRFVDSGGAERLTATHLVIAS